MLYLVPLVVLIFVSILPMTAAAQQPPVVISPDVGGDRSVVFRLWAPKALEVQLSGDWMSAPMALVKDEQGVWTITQSPLEPNVYQYAFLVDGMRSDDPSCRCTYAFGAGRGVSSRFTIPRQPPAPWEGQARPAGTLHRERFYSKSQARMRAALVYTPPGYDPKAPRRYPVLVLLSGAPGDETEWTTTGLAEVVFDNLIAERTMMPAIVVMHASDVDPRAATRRGDQNLGQLERILVDELVPLIKERYTVRTDASSWAIAGVSLGGEFAMYAGLRHPKLFGSLASISGSLVPRGDPEEGLPSMDERFGPLLARTDLARNYRLIWIGCGSADVVCRGSRVFVQRLEAAKAPHVWREYTGGHQMLVFRRELIDLLALLFR
jgi:enterochelin esterase-like enzyme